MSLTDVKQKKDAPTAVQLFHNSLDKFLAKDMKGWTDLCNEGVVARWQIFYCRRVSSRLD